MKIFVIGNEIVNVERIKKILKKKGNNFKKRVFSKKEIFYCENKIKSYTYFAKRFAAKEALSKALGTGIRKGIDFKDIDKFISVYKLLGGEAKAQFEAQMESVLKTVDEKTRKL